MNDKLIPQSEMLKILGVSRKTFNQWKRMLIPTVKKDNTKRIFLNIADCKEWMAVNNKVDYLVLLEKAYPGVKPTPPANMPKVVFHHNDKSPGYDIFEVKKRVSQMFIETANKISNSDRAELTAIEINNISKLSAEQRRLEEACIELNIKLKNLIKVSEVEKLFGRLANSLKTSFLSLSSAVADDISIMSDPQEISEYLDVEIKKILRELSSLDISKTPQK